MQGFSTLSKETYYSVKRDLCEREPSHTHLCLACAFIMTILLGTSLSRFDMALLPHLARAEYAGVCLDLSRLSDISSVVRQRKERLAEDLEMQTSVRHAVIAAAQNAAWRSQMEAERRVRSQGDMGHGGAAGCGKGGSAGGGGQMNGVEERNGDFANVAKKENAAIAQIQSVLELLYRLRRTW